MKKLFVFTSVCLEKTGPLFDLQIFDIHTGTAGIFYFYFFTYGTGIIHVHM